MWKTTVAVELAKILSLNHFELDAFHWKPNWQTNLKSEFDQILRGSFIMIGVLMEIIGLFVMFCGHAPQI